MRKQRRSRTRTVSVEHLLRDGHWGKLRCGLSRQALVRILGAPTRWQRSTAELQAMAAGTPVAGWALSEVLHYDGFEFHFTDQPTSRCIRLFCDDLDALGGGQQLRVNPWGLTEGMPVSDLADHLSSAGLVFQRITFHQAPRQIRLVLDSGARLGLTDDPAFFAPGTPEVGQRLFCVEVASEAE